MTGSDPDLAAVMERLPVLRRYEEVVCTRLHPWAQRLPGARADTLDRIVRYFHDNVQDASSIDRAFLKRLVLFVDQLMDGRLPEEAVELALDAHPDPLSVDRGASERAARRALRDRAGGVPRPHGRAEAQAPRSTSTRSSSPRRSASWR